MTPEEGLARLRRLRRGAPAAIAASLNEVGYKILGQVREVWPVDTGLSRERFYFEPAKGSRSIRLRFRNEVSYSGAVHDRLYLRLFPRLCRDAEPEFRAILLKRLREL